jgi:hypothetical protein
MLIFSMLCLIFLVAIGAILFIDCKIVDDLPEDNTFKIWWRNHVIAPDPRD